MEQIERIAALARRARGVALADWRGTRRLSGGAAVLLWTLLVVLADYANHPHVELSPDSHEYIARAAAILAGGHLVDPIRLPGYPLVIALVWRLRGQPDLVAVSAVQGALFVLAALEVYALCWLIWRRTRVALAVGLPVGGNLYLLKDVKPIISDGLALWLVMSLTLAAALYARRPRARTLWLVAGLLLALCYTRPEWVYAPPLVLGALLVAARRGAWRRLWPHALAALALIYLAVGLLIARNAAVYGYAGLTPVQNVNLLGKVMQYGMQHEAPPEYAAVTRAIDRYLAAGHNGPWALVNANHDLHANHYDLCRRYALAIILRHPIEFGAKTLVVLFTSNSLGYTHDDLAAVTALRPGGPFGAPLALLWALCTAIYATYILFPLAALWWLARWLRPHTRPATDGAGDEHAARAAPLGIVALLGLYALTIFALGGYGDYARLHTEFAPLMLVVLWGGALGAWGRLRWHGIASATQP